MIWITPTHNDGGKYTIDLTTIHPYFGWQDERNSVWGSIGGGDGKLVDNRDGGGGERHDASLKTFTIGGDTRLGAGYPSPKIKAELSRSELSVDDEERTNIKTQTAKVLIATDLPLSDQLTGNIEVGLSNQSGDNKTGTAAELKTGIAANKGKLKLAANLHMSTRRKQPRIRNKRNHPPTTRQRRSRAVANNATKLLRRNKFRNPSRLRNNGRRNPLRRVNNQPKRIRLAMATQKTK